MITKLTAAQKKAWELIKSELALPDTERQKNDIFGKEYGKSDVFTLLNKKRIARKTMWALYHAGLIDPTDTWNSRFYFRLTDAGKAETKEYSFSECISEANRYMHEAFEAINEMIAVRKADKAAQWFELAGIAQKNGFAIR